MRSSRICRSSSSRCNHEPDGHFPNGVPNPDARGESRRHRRGDRARTARMWARLGRRLRPLLFLRRARAVHRGLLPRGAAGRELPAREPGGAHRARSAPHLEHHRHRAAAAAATPVLSKSGHAFIKQKMREVDGVYGGEMSAHHYFRRFAYCDSGMIPWLLVLAGHQRVRRAAVGAGGRAHAAVSGERRDQPRICSGCQGDPRAGARRTTSRRPRSIDLTDGLSMEFAEWRFNLRGSNTEPLVRLNVESRGSERAHAREDRRGAEARRRVRAPAVAAGTCPGGCALPQIASGKRRVRRLCAARPAVCPSHRAGGRPLGHFPASASRAAAGRSCGLPQTIGALGEGDRALGVLAQRRAGNARDRWSPPAHRRNR